VKTKEHVAGRQNRNLVKPKNLTSNGEMRVGLKDGEDPGFSQPAKRKGEIRGERREKTEGQIHTDDGWGRGMGLTSSNYGAELFCCECGVLTKYRMRKGPSPSRLLAGLE